MSGVSHSIMTASPLSSTSVSASLNDALVVRYSSLDRSSVEAPPSNMPNRSCARTPAFTSKSTHSCDCASTANSPAHLPFLSSAFQGAPRSSNKATTSALPVAAARISALSPEASSCADAGAPLSKRSRTRATSPAVQAASVSATDTAVASSSAILPLCTALCSGPTAMRNDADDLRKLVACTNAYSGTSLRLLAACLLAARAKHKVAS